jgi:DNA-directed RNA polymerase specialized sigma24 family protein
LLRINHTSVADRQHPARNNHSIDGKNKTRAISRERHVFQSDSPWVECERSDAAGQLRASVVPLPEKYRRVILLPDLEALSISAVAGRVVLTIPAVTVIYERGSSRERENLILQ